MSVISRTSVCLELARTFQGCSAACAMMVTNWTAAVETALVSSDTEQTQIDEAEFSRE